MFINVETMIMDTLKNAGKPLKTGEISDLTGIDKKEVSKGLKGLKVQDKITSPKNCYYSIK